MNPFAEKLMLRDGSAIQTGRCSRYHSIAEGRGQVQTNRRLEVQP